MFTIVIPFFNGHQYIDKLLDSIPESIPVIIVDDLSEKPLASRPNTEIIRLENKGYFTGAVNAGIEACDNDVLILNQDTYFTDDSWLNFVQENVLTFGVFGESAGNHPAWPRRYVHGTFMYIRRDVINAIGLMDADNYPLWGSTCDYQLKACRKGFEAYPARKIPGFIHERKGNFGSAIKETLNKTKQRGRLIRTPPLVSVIITCYNHGQYLEDAVNSLIGGHTSLGHTEGQTLQSFEIIIVDDGSTDGSGEIVEKLANPFKGIHILRQANKGSAVAVNHGIQASHARDNSLIAILDGDDMMESNRLETMANLYAQNPDSVIYDNIRYFGNGRRGIVTNWETGKTINKLNLGNYDFEKVLYKNVMHKGLMYPKKAWLEAGGYPAVMNQGREDWAFNVALGIKGWCGVNTGKYEYLYRREGQNRTLRNTTPKHHSFFLGQIRSLFPDIYEGVRPVGCCGSRNKNSSGSSMAAASVRNSKDLPGQDGMVILEYIGGNGADLTWHGPVTRTQYILGGSRLRGYVDKQDAPGMLAIRKKGKAVFAEVEALPKVEIPSEPSLKASVILKTIQNLKQSLPQLSEQELEELLDIEESGKNRVSAKNLIEAQLERVA